MTRLLFMGPGDGVFVLTLEEGVRDLERVEGLEFNVVNDVGDGRRGADEPDLPLFLQPEERLHDVITLNRGQRWADVKLQQVE